jgi:hypothetical protein
MATKIEMLQMVSDGSEGTETLYLVEGNRQIVVHVDLPCQQWTAYEDNDYTRQRGNTIHSISSSGTKMRPTEADELFPWMNPAAWRR